MFPEATLLTPEQSVGAVLALILSGTSTTTFSRVWGFLLMKNVQDTVSPRQPILEKSVLSLIRIQSQIPFSDVMIGLLPLSDDLLLAHLQGSLLYSWHSAANQLKQNFGSALRNYLVVEKSSPFAKMDRYVGLAEA